jgi:hypothetical protein
MRLSVREPHEVRQRHQPRQEIRGSAGEGPAVSLSGISDCAVSESPPGSVSPSTQTAGPSPALRFSRDDKLEGCGPPGHEWRGMDRVKQPASYAYQDCLLLPIEELIWTSVILSRPFGTGRDFLPRCAREFRVCSFHEGKARGVYQRHQTSQEIRVKPTIALIYLSS